MRLLIDGYNVLFQSPLVGRGRAAGWLERARSRLTRLLCKHLDPTVSKQTVVVFDASQNSASNIDFIADCGIRIVFAVAHPEADDLLEELIRKHPHPKTLRVVSSDQRIRRCARARKAISADSESFLDELERHHSMQPSSFPPDGTAPQDQGFHPTPQDDLTLSEEEIDFWLREFGSDSDSET